jgi:RimJ/RimL family protein N-acetyltransferase
VKNPFLIGAQIYLRPLERGDAPLFVSWINDPEVRHTLLRYWPLSLQAEEEFLDKLNRSEHDLALGIAVRQTDRLIGAAGLHQIDYRNRHTSFGILIGEKGEWGKGYGTEATALMVRYAFETLNLNRVWLHVYEDNQRGIRSYEKVGFLKEGVLRQENYRAGRYGNTLTMAILRDEWQARNNIADCRLQIAD